ncbi:aromatic amino acid DMT transporter YddG [Pantoea anthophila]|uniref:aromatic amino acid DMT transporter YddG n=1 Tax=Pantoea anthophila TaxID=470931 RepID=UPI0028A1FFC8|nr:aromatic amino acid DMT transporter YddG [Pantoea anthophila]
MPATVSRATLIGLIAILLWSTTVGLLRSVSEAFGATGGAALIYTTTACLLCLTRGMPRPGAMPAIYLWIGGALFVGYEMALALAIGLASDRRQSLELGMINYLWPCLTIVLAIPFNQQRFRVWLWPGLLLSLLGIVWVMKGSGSGAPALLWQNMLRNPVAYALFFILTALALWLKFAVSPTPLTFAPLPLLEVLFVGLSTAIAYSAWNHGIQQGNLTLLATASYFTPVLSALLGSLWLGLTPPLAFWQGVAMITLGSLICWLATRPR